MITVELTEDEALVVYAHLNLVSIRSTNNAVDALDAIGEFPDDVRRYKRKSKEASFDPSFTAYGKFKEALSND